MRKLFFFILLALPCLVNAQTQSIKIYGGDNHSVYLGKFDAPASDAESIWNKEQFGNIRNEACIWDLAGKYGNPESKYSPWHELNDCTPILVDDKGNEVCKFNAACENEQVQFVCMFYATITDGSYSLQYWFNSIFADTYQEEYDMKYFAPKEMLE